MFSHNSSDIRIMSNLSIIFDRLKKNTVIFEQFSLMLKMDLAKQFSIF